MFRTRPDWPWAHVSPPHSTIKRRRYSRSRAVPLHPLWAFVSFSRVEFCVTVLIWFGMHCVQELSPQKLCNIRKVDKEYVTQTSVGNGDKDIFGLLGCYEVNDVSEQPIGSIFKEQSVQISPETSVTNHSPTLRNIPDGQRSHLYRGGSLKSRKG